MACKCKTKSEKIQSPDYTITPEAECIFCGEKHFSTAMALAHELGYVAVNRQSIIGELVLAQWHIWRKDFQLAESLRDLRHIIQNRRENELKNEWEIISEHFDKLIKEK